MNHNKKLEGISGVIRRYFYPKEFFSWIILLHDFVV